ncbi:fimbrillin family protein [Segatella copri]|uniref:fimbrillin family protein n=1 Tax=Segatella copri TaxID=165179 RepID=UPI00294AE00A|nr:fimbrillin family protein [Segatella copri]WOG32308.1 fimbrillin family protein [Segatella copri]
MYKKIFMGIAAVAALTLVSCSSDDLNSLSDNSSKNEAISFDGYLGRSAVSVNGSRGSVLEIDDLKTSTDGFGVFGNYKEADGLEFGSNWFKNVKVTYSSKDTKWTYSPVRYWLPQGHIDFLAYAPRVEGKTLTNTSIDFTVEGDVAKQKDLLWANAKGQTKQTISNTENKVNFKFAHALSRLGYTVKLKEPYSDATITLNKITLAGSEDGTTKTAFYKKGTIDLSYTSSSTASLWNTSSFDKQNFTWFSGNQKLTDKVDNNTEYLFVIPQDFSATATDKLYVIVEYTIQNNGVTETMKNTVRQQIKMNFLQGKAYTINLTIGLTPIEFDADVTPWGNGDNEDINSWN